MAVIEVYVRSSLVMGGGPIGLWLAPLPFTPELGFGSQSRRFERNKNVSSPFTCENQFVGSLRDREVACSASDRQGSNVESCVWRTVSSQSSHHPQEVLLAQFSLYVHKGGIKPDSFHFISSLVIFGFQRHNMRSLYNRIKKMNECSFRPPLCT